jgi:hypothetical protein
MQGCFSPEESALLRRTLLALRKTTANNRAQEKEDGKDSLYTHKLTVIDNILSKLEHTDAQEF